jgi:hypothetical protein
MSIDKKILEELKRFNQINAYINEQAPPEDPLAAAPPPPGDAAAPPPPPPGDDAAAPPPPPGGDAAAPPAEGGGDAGGATEVPEPIDVEKDPDIEEVGDDKGGEEETEEVDITDLVTNQEEIKNKQEEFMNSMFSKLDDLEKKLQHMDDIMNKINSLETKFDKYRDKTPEEKLMLRSLDSYPYNQKLTDFFDDKKDEMEETGKNEYVLTSDDVENFSANEVKKTFNDFQQEDEM